MELFLFYLFSLIALISAAAVILARQPTRALLSLILTLFSLAVLYVLLGAPFVAMVHLIVYAGAVLVLFLFVIMLQGIGAKDIPLAGRFHKSYFVLAAFAACAFGGMTLFVLGRFLFAPATPKMGTTDLIANKLFTQYLIPFELTSLVLLIGVFAAVRLSKREDL